MTLDYIPYIGAACTTLILLGVGLVSFPSLGYALVPPAAFVGGDDRRPIYQSDRVAIGSRSIRWQSCWRSRFGRGCGVRWGHSSPCR